jgi:hypothetical protein
VNPPQNPTVRKSFQPGDRRELLSENPYINPINRQPVILTKNVPIGNADGKLFCRYFEARNLEMLPRNPPVPINSNDFIISILTEIIQALSADAQNLNPKVLIQLIEI